MKRRGFLEICAAAVGAVAVKALPRGHEPKAIEGELAVSDEPQAGTFWEIDPAAYARAIFFAACYVRGRGRRPRRSPQGT